MNNGTKFGLSSPLTARHGVLKAHCPSGVCPDKVFAVGQEEEEEGEGGSASIKL
jgi:hypothetical protein